MPTVGPVTARVYGDLPALYRDADQEQTTGPNYPLLRYLATILDQLTATDELLERIGFEPLDERMPALNVWKRYGTARYGTSLYGDSMHSELLDPLLAQARWLPWLAWILGQSIVGLSTSGIRDLLDHPVYDRGTIAALVRAIRAETGATYVDVIPHYGANPFVIGIRVLAAEVAQTATWQAVQTHYPTWADWRRAGSWAKILESDVAAAIESQRPAGYTVTLIRL